MTIEKFLNKLMRNYFMVNFKKEVAKLQEAYEEIVKFEVDISQPIMPSLDFHKSRQNLYLQNLQTVVTNLQKSVNVIDVEDGDEAVLDRIKGIVNKLETKNNNELKLLTDELIKLTNDITIKEEQKIKIPVSIPNEIFSELEADVNEMQNCFNSGSYRSVVILCGRILEVVLHRKYFDVTGNDLLEKSPGIGLGNLIGKMNEKGIQFDPGLTQQIHLINQIRVFSVHKKQNPFYPSRAQAQAIMLYTGDVLEKVFI